MTSGAEAISLFSATAVIAATPSVVTLARVLDKTAWSGGVSIRILRTGRGCPGSAAMYVSLETLRQAVSLVDRLAELDHPAGFAGIVLPGLAGWVPIYNLNLSEDVPGYIQAPATALSYPWTHFICGHLGRLATRDDVSVHQQYIADIEAGAREALATVDPVPFYMRYGENVWAGVKAHLDTVTERAAAPIIAKYTGVLAAADIEIFTTTTTFAIMQSLRLDRGPSGPVHP